MTDAGPIALDEDAAATIRSLIDDRDLDAETAGLRLWVEPGGCAGLVYEMALVEAPEPDDVVCECDGVRVFLDGASHQHLAGAELAVEATAHGTGFTVENPNSVQECGCGLSFQSRR